MIITLQEGREEAEIDWKHWDLTLHGKAIDDRGFVVLESVRHRAIEMTEVVYDPFQLKVAVGNERIAADDLTETLATTRGMSVLIEATTLGFAEIVLICKALREIKHDSIDIVYLEPSGYQRELRHPLLKRRDFELSSEVPGYRAIPGSAVLLGDRKKVRSVFFLGYEEARLRRAFEELQMLSPASTAVAFGVPAFRAGWEMDAMANNISVIREQNMRGGVHFCGAENPLAVFELLCEVHRGLDQGERLVLAPIGTKPHGIGVALFAAAHSEVGVLYDHPLRAPGRTTDLGHWHLFSIDDFQGG
ncbi:MAG: hypothetical protein KDA90_21350 [Planctomycetaceae bacterium]|nr:hypothetical protein [Planctomycetaceae bacterium]